MRRQLEEAADYAMEHGFRISFAPMAFRIDKDGSSKWVTFLEVEEAKSNVLIEAMQNWDDLTVAEFLQRTKK